jgi:RNA polymerase sigma-70 factor, ECF subfamily
MRGARARKSTGFPAKSSATEPVPTVPGSPASSLLNVREWTQPLPVVASDGDLEREFDVRLTESSTLAFRVAYGVLRHREDAEDVAQEAFAKAYRSFRNLRDRDRFRAWLVKMTWRLAIDRIRSNRRRRAHEYPVEHAPDPHVDADPASDLDARERQKHLWVAIDELPESQRIVTVLAAIEGHDLKEVSRLLDVPEGTIKWRLFTARKTLQEKLGWMIAPNR